MPVNAKFDVLIDGKGYMLSRATQLRGRAWQRTGLPDTPDKRPRIAEEYGVLPPQIDFPEVWDDWSGGFGYPYREPKDTQSIYGFYANPNTYHWAENFDSRYPHQLVHAQQMGIIPGHPNVGSKVLNLLDVPAPSLNGPIVAGMGGVFISVAGSPTGNSGRLYPTGLQGSVDSFDLVNLEPMAAGPGKPAIFGSYVYISSLPIANARMNKTSLDDTAVGGGSTNEAPQGYTTAGNRLWDYHGAGRRIYVDSVAAGADPQNPANHSATLNIGNGQAQINDMIAYNEQVFVGLENGLYAGDQSGTFVNVLSDLAGHADADNCRDLAIHNGQVVAQHIAGVFAYNPTITTQGQVREIGPNLFSNQSPVAGMVKTLKTGGPWLYAGLWTGTQGYLLAGVDDNPPGPYSWHVMQKLPHHAKPTRIHIDGIVAPSGGVAGQIPQRMWVATDPSGAGTAPLYVWPIPYMNGDPLGTLNDFHSKANFNGSARMDLGVTNSRAPGTPKLYRSVTIEAENLASPYRYCDVYYTIDRGVRTLLGRAIDSPRSVLYFPSTVGSFSTGYGVELSLESFATPNGVAFLTGGNPVICSPNAGYSNLSNGDTVQVICTIAGITSLTGSWVVTVIDPSSFSLNGSNVTLPGGVGPVFAFFTYGAMQNQVSPVYRSLVLRSTFRPNSVDVISAVLDMADNTRDRQGATMRPGDTQLAELRALSRQSNPVTLIDLAGATSVVEVTAPVEEVEVYQAGNDNPTVAATIKMAVMSFSGQ